MAMARSAEIALSACPPGASVTLKELLQMTENGFPVGLEMEVTYPAFQVSLTLLSANQMTFEIKEGPFARTETVRTWFDEYPTSRMHIFRTHQHHLRSSLVELRSNIAIGQRS